MRSAKTSHPAPSPPVKSGGSRPWQLLLWGVFAVNSLFFIPQCLDRWLAPRFFFLSAVLLAGVVLLWKHLREKADWRLHGFDLLLLGWYGLNLASVSWAFSWSEGIFYAQKTMLLFLCYWLVRQALVRDEVMVRQTLRQATTFLTFAVSGILLVQLTLAISQHGLDNEKLYDYASGVFGNKSLASDFLFFLLVFNVLFQPQQVLGENTKHGSGSTKHGSVRSNGWAFWLPIGLLLVLILLLQTRAVYIATGVGALIYFAGRALLEPDFSLFFRKKILPTGALALGLLLAFLALKGGKGSVAERLNPLTYLESATANERRFVWYKTDLLNAEHFWWGVGNGSWKFWFPSKNIEGAYRLQEQNVVFTRAHNDYLEVRSEMGIIGVTLFFTLFGAAFFMAFWVLRRRGAAAPVQHDLIVLMAGLSGYCIIQYFDFPRERIEMQVVLAMLFAYTAFHARELWAKLPGWKFSNPTIFLGVSIAGLLFNLVVGQHRIQGEMHNVQMLEAMSQRQHRATIQEARAAQNRFYEYTDVAMPLPWYEGVAFYQMNEVEKSVNAFGQAYRLNPWSFQVINNYASALVRNGQYREAIPLYERVVEINPRYEDGKFNLAFALFQAGDHPKSLEWLHRMDTIPNPKTDEERQKKKRQADLRKALEAQ